MIAPTGPVIVAEQLPDSNPIKKVAMQFREVYQKALGEPTSDGFSAYAYDGYLIFADAAKRALAKAKPGTPEFRTALRDAMFETKELTGTHAVYNFKTGALYVHTPGPWFETPTEDRLYRKLGLDLVGKTAGPEFRLARMYGMCLGIVSIVVNPAEGLGEFEHADLRSIYRRCGPTMARLVIEALADADQATSAPRCTCIDEPGASLFREFAPHARYGGDRPHG